MIASMSVPVRSIECVFTIIGIPWQQPSLNRLMMAPLLSSMDIVLLYRTLNGTASEQYPIGCHHSVKYRSISISILCSPTANNNNKEVGIIDLRPMVDLLPCPRVINRRSDLADCFAASPMF